MRNFISLVISFAIILATVPSVGLLYKSEITSAENGEDTVKFTTVQNSEKNADKVRVYLTGSKKIITVSVDEYVAGVLAKEIDLGAPEEALKAQAVCIYTYYLHIKKSLKEKSYDISDDPSVHQSFADEAELKKKWGENFKANSEKLKKITKAVHRRFMSYNGEVILAAYHSSNSGQTEASENYWGKAYPYLVSTFSPGDRLSPSYMSKNEFTPEKFKAALKKGCKNKQFKFAQSPSDWLGTHEESGAGTVLHFEVGGLTLTGREVREALGLKSAVFKAEYKNGKFIFTVYGYGHGVGFSQEGAKYMASCGFSYEDILRHYYNGVEITR